MGKTHKKHPGPAKSRLPRGSNGSQSIICAAVYDGRVRLGSVKECAEGGFVALTLSGVSLGHFPSMKSAAGAVSLGTVAS